MHTLDNRGTGRSTIIALETIAKAMRQEGLQVHVTDHHGTAEADRHLSNMIMSIITDLKLSGFTLKHTIPPLLLFKGTKWD